MKKIFSIAIVCFIVLSAFTMSFAEESPKTATMVWQKINFQGYGQERQIKVTITNVVGIQLDENRVRFEELKINFLDTYDDDEKYFTYDSETYMSNYNGKGEGNFENDKLIVIPVAPGAELKIEVLDGGENLEFFPGSYPIVDDEKMVVVNGMGQADNYSTGRTYEKKLSDMESGRKYIHEMPITIDGQKFGIAVVDPATYPLPSTETTEEKATEEKATEETTTEVKEEVKATEEKKEAGLNNFTAVKTYENNTFNDVKEADWYAASVKSTYELGILGGKGEGVFDPAGKIKVSEAIAMVSRTKDIYTGGTGAIEKTGENWYDGFVKYAIDNGIITDGQFDDYNRNASRAELAYLFAVAVGDDCYEAINTVTKIADVDESTQYTQEIFKLYNAGIVTGADEYGTFNPSAEITRAEASALINRLINKEMRKNVVLKEKQ